LETEETYQVLLVCREGRPGEPWAEALAEAPYRLQWVHDGEQALSRLKRDPVDVVVYESSPRRIGLTRLLQAGREAEHRPVQIILSDGLKAEEVAALIRAGADDIIERGAPVELLRQRLRLYLDRQPVLSAARPTGETSPLDRLVGRSAAMAELKRRLQQLAPTRSAVLFTGETGTGKTLAAEVLHALSPRGEAPFRRVDCPALSRTLVESELFGHEKGAFTDAKQARSGVFERAEGGTVLLEEVGDLPGPTQSHILRFLETGEIRRIGSSQALRPDVRVLVATAEPLADLALRGGIRKNLLYRLEGVCVHLPPLRERREDIPDLIRCFLPRLCRHLGRAAPRLTRRAVQRLSSLQWPGNVRQLLHTLEGILATSKSELIDIADIPLELRGRERKEKSLRIPLGSSLAEVEKVLISETLKLTGGDKGVAAKMLGIGLRTLYRKIKLYGI